MEAVESSSEFSDDGLAGVETAMGGAEGSPG